MSWSWSDAWLLTAAHYSKENPVSLTGLIAAGDDLNHALFLDRELDEGMTRLTAAGLARLDGEAIVLTAEAIRMCDRAVESTTAIREAMKKVEQELKEIDLSGRELTPVEVPKAAVTAAIKQYHANAAAARRST